MLPQIVCEYVCKCLTDGNRKIYVCKLLIDGSRNIFDLIFIGARSEIPYRCSFVCEITSNPCSGHLVHFCGLYSTAGRIPIDDR